MKSLVRSLWTLLLACVVLTACNARGGSTSSDASPPATVDSQLGTHLGAGDHTRTLRHDGRSRSYIVHVPTSAVVPAPVVVAFHGGGGTGVDFQDQNGLDGVADREGFITVYPEGTGILPNRLHTWNSGDTCCGFALDRDIDDVGFVRELIVELTADGLIDAQRVYLTGHSNGAMMAYRVAVEASELVTAIVPVGGAVDLAQPQPSEPVPLLHIHSLDDPRALYGGGEGPPFPGTDRTVYHAPVIDGIESWAAANGCAPGPTSIDAVTGTGANDGHSAERLAWTACDSGAHVEHLILTGSGHGWPGVTAPRLVQRHLGAPTTLIDASEEVWAFASQFDG